MSTDDTHGVMDDGGVDGAGETDADEATTVQWDGDVTPTPSELRTVSRDAGDTIELSYVVDVSDIEDADQREILACLAASYEHAYAEVVAKNRDYSWSFLRTGQKLAETPAVPFETPVRAQVFGLLTRMGDKQERLMENVYGNGGSTVSDSPATTARELANYAMFLSLILENPELAERL
jgi:hypothetical protein